jgi:hypothetical protein
MIVVDSPVFLKPNGRKRYSHLAGSSLVELHAFAAGIGVKEHFFHRGTSHPHYDITEAQVPAAIAAGAVLVSSKVLLRLAKTCFAGL